MDRGVRLNGGNWIPIKLGECAPTQRMQTLEQHESSVGAKCRRTIAAGRGEKKGITATLLFYCSLLLFWRTCTLALYCCCSYRMRTGTAATLESYYKHGKQARDIWVIWRHRQTHIRRDQCRLCGRHYTLIPFQRSERIVRAAQLPSQSNPICVSHLVLYLA